MASTRGRTASARRNESTGTSGEAVTVGAPPFSERCTSERPGRAERYVSRLALGLSSALPSTLRASTRLEAPSQTSGDADADTAAASGSTSRPSR